MKIDTRAYQRTHGCRPCGFGTWAFRVNVTSARATAPHEVDLTATGDYATATATLTAHVQRITRQHHATGRVTITIQLLP